MEAMEFFAKGGPVMYLLLISSIAVATIGIERFRFYRYAKNDSESFLNGLTSRLKAQDINATLELCRNENSSVGKVARSGIEAAEGLPGDPGHIVVHILYVAGEHTSDEFRITAACFLKPAGNHPAEHTLCFKVGYGDLMDRFRLIKFILRFDHLLHLEVAGG